MFSDSKWWSCVMMASVFHSYVWSHRKIKCSGYCQCYGHTMKCDAAEFPLNYIPETPIKIKTVEIEYMNLGDITRETFVNLTTCKLTSFILYDTNITNISEDAFLDLRYLTNLRLTQAFLSFTSVENIARSLGNISKLYITAGKTDVDRFDSAIFKDLKRLKKLTLSFKTLKEFNATYLSELQVLDLLNLSSNSLGRLELERVIPNVRNLYLAGNNFIEFPHICRSDCSVPLMPRLRSLDMTRNAIRQFDVTPLSCLPNLLKLTLSQNRIDRLLDNAFVDLKRLSSLYMHDVPLVKISDHAFNSSSLQKLMFTSIPILSVRRFNPATLFKHTPNLATLDMTNTKMDIGVGLLKVLLLNLRNIQRLTLQRTYIKELPTGVFSKLTKLKKLVLSGNYIASWDKDVFKNVTSIETIILDGCNIGMIDEQSFPLEFRLHVKEINLANNPYICTCDLLWYRTWMKEVMTNRSITFLNYPFRYYCRSPGLVDFKLRDFNPTAESCKTTPWYVIFLPVFFSLVLLVVVVGLVAYRYRWYLLYWVSLLRRRRHREQVPLREMQYDAFISYSNNDDEWVYEELLKFAEGEIGLHLCEHSRDFAGGKLIIDNVFTALDTSRKTIVVISNEYMKSDWCQFELQMALNSFYKHETDLVVVLLEQVDARHVTSTLRALMTSTTYLEWPNDLVGRNLFWERLKTALTT